MRKIIPAVVAGATALVLAGGAFGYVTLNKDVTLSVDGVPTELSTMSGTVGDLLVKEGITLSERDVIAPGVDTDLADGTRIAVQYAREIKVTVDGQPQSFWTTATRVDTALSALKVDTATAELSTSRSAAIGREGLSLDLVTEKAVKLDHAGKVRSITTHAQTVAEVLAESKIKIDANDTVSPAASSRVTDGGSIRYTKVDTRTVTETKDVDFTTIRKDSSTLAKGKTEVAKAGVKGERTITYAETLHNGKVADRKKTGSEVTTKPVTKVLLVGTKEPTIEKKSSQDSAADSGSSDGNAPSVGSGSVWDRLADCEASGNWSINTGNGFYGGLQFTLSTWRAYGGSGMPHRASREQQIAIGKKVQQGQGWRAWPACTSKLGIR